MFPLQCRRSVSKVICPIVSDETSRIFPLLGSGRPHHNKAFSVPRSRSRDVECWCCEAWGRNVPLSSRIQRKDLRAHTHTHTSSRTLPLCLCQRSEPVTSIMLLPLLFSPPPRSTYGWGARGLPRQPSLRGSGGSVRWGREGRGLEAAQTKFSLNIDDCTVTACV